MAGYDRLIRCGPASGWPLSLGPGCFCFRPRERSHLDRFPRGPPCFARAKPLVLPPLFVHGCPTDLLPPRLGPSPPRRLPSAPPDRPRAACRQGEFELVHREDLPLLVREHARQFRWAVADASIWRRRPAA
jgi:hypothetical protein